MYFSCFSQKIINLKMLQNKDKYIYSFFRFNVICMSGSALVFKEQFTNELLHLPLNMFFFVIVQERLKELLVPLVLLFFCFIFFGCHCSIVVCFTQKKTNKVYAFLFVFKKEYSYFISFWFENIWPKLKTNFFSLQLK
jgi:hypothetical protein